MEELNAKGLDLDKRIFSYSASTKGGSNDTKLKPSSGYPFEAAVDMLEDIGLLLVPTDMVMAVHSALKITHDTAVQILKSSAQNSTRESGNHTSTGNITTIRNSISYGGGAEGGGMGMDDVFPLFLWVVIHANVADIGRCLYIMEHYSTQQERMSALGWCTTSLAAAVTHISQLGNPNHSNSSESE